VHGKVTLNGEPVANADVEFHPESEPKLGIHGAKTDASGMYQLRPSSGSEVPAGRYKVVVKRYVLPDGSPPDPEDDPMLLAEGKTRTNLPPQ
jgi:hypothetical protein